MRRIRIFSEVLTDCDFVELDKRNSHYLVNVLRCTVGDKVEVLSGDGRLYSGILVRDGGRYKIEKLREELVQSECIPVINLYIGVIKGNNFDYAIEKASELGVFSVTPFYSDFSNIKVVSHERIKRFLRIARSSALQCGRIKIMEINKPIYLNEVFGHVPFGNNIYLDPSEEERFISDSVDFLKPFNIFSGPEGGFSPKEIATFKKNGFMGLSLGSNILRAETIPIVICTIIQYEYARRKRFYGR
ncbi:MAG: 16S rRNA (uracil(1498)-N(3))-methyltransferase [Deltaproteobacteria bacterium]|nr:16S rRNA (uracil(1498)-N(3))-methyltransferase [Deltaproteobacteria bacterium]